MRATAPHSHGASSRLPATRSFSIDDLISAGRPSANVICCATKSSASATPCARPTAHASRIAASSVRAQVGVGAQHADRLPRDARQAGERRQEARTSPTARGGCRRRARRRCPRRLQAASSASAAGCCAGSTGPKRSRAIVPVCAMTPGLARSSRRCTRRRPSRARRRRSRRSRSMLLDAVLERDRRRRRRDQRADRRRRALGVPELDREHDDVGRRRASPGRRSTAASRQVAASPSALSTRQAALAHRREMRARARRTRRRARACASLAPKYPPTPPAPITAMRIVASPCRSPPAQYR